MGDEPQAVPASRRKSLVQLLVGIGVTALLIWLTSGWSAGGATLAMWPMWFTARFAFRVVSPVRAARWERKQAARQAAAEVRGPSFRGLIFSWVIVLGVAALGAWLLVDEVSSGHGPSFWYELLIVGGSGVGIGLMVHETRKYRRRH